MLYISKLIKVVSSMYMDYLIYLPYVGTVCNSSLTHNTKYSNTFSIDFTSIFIYNIPKTTFQTIPFLIFNK